MTLFCTLTRAVSQLRLEEHTTDACVGSLWEAASNGSVPVRSFL